MKKYLLYFLLLSLFFAKCSFSHAQKKYFTDIADSLRIDSILKAESNYPSNMVMVRSDTSGCTIYSTPSKNAEILSVMGLLEFPAAIIISKANKETINGKTDYWYRVYFEQYPGPMTGWVFGGDAVLLTPDMESNPAAYNGKYIQYVGDPCIYGLSIRANSTQNIIAKTYDISYGLDEPSLCSGITVSLNNVKIKGNIFSSDSSDFKKGWFMKAAKKANTKFKGFLMMQSESGFYPYLKLNSSTEIIDYEFLYITGENVNLRQGSSTNSAVVQQLYNGTPCQIIEKGPAQTINGITDRWYHVNVYGQKGWVFGEFTNMKNLK